MTPSHKRGRARLMMRLPDWRAAFQQSSNRNFLDVCEAYDLAHVGLDYWMRSNRPIRSVMIAEYRELMAFLELDAQLWVATEMEAAEGTEPSNELLH